MGATARPKPGREALGPITARVFYDTPDTVIAVRTRREVVYPEPTAESAADQGLPAAAQVAAIDPAAISGVVDKWFAENTFHSREFEDLEALVQLKRSQGLTISLCLPALNEERTVGHVIDTVKGALMDRVPLLDEIVLIDSNSSDRTREIARELGVPVYIHQEILPEHGAYRGKGEALWKSLHVLRGDIIAWIDTDITNIDPRFVYGILGPLLREERVQYVKGFYRRPLHVGDQLQAGGGGRVTELVARPMLNLFYPVLSGVVQPLSGEYAGRRAALEKLPFFTGYGVETGLLIDMLNTFGLQAIAQCDLEERIHKNQELAALGKMSFQILQVFVRRLQGRYGPMLAEINKTMKLVQHDEDRFYLDGQDIEEYERPPMIEVPEYLAARHSVHA
jgi:glucosyl-3-phosphoglycerate synthase